MSDAFDRAAQRESEARRARRAKPAWGAFSCHLRNYLYVNAFLAALWAVTAVFAGADEPWFLHVAWGWGIGVAVHYLVVARITGHWRSPRSARRIKTL